MTPVASYGGGMRYARSGALDELEPLLEELRRVPGLVEKARGTFYRKSKAFLHFHEDASGLHADVRRAGEFERFRVETVDEREQLLEMVRSLSIGPAATTRRAASNG